MKYIVFLILAFFSVPAYAWDGYDWQKGNYIEIDKGNLVREGRDIEIYDYSSGQYRDVEVQDVRPSYGGGAEVEVYDYNSGEYRTFDMDAD